MAYRSVFYRSIPPPEQWMSKLMPATCVPRQPVFGYHGVRRIRYNKMPLTGYTSVITLVFAVNCGNVAVFGEPCPLKFGTRMGSKRNHTTGESTTGLENYRCSKLCLGRNPAVTIQVHRGLCLSLYTKCWPCLTWCSHTYVRPIIAQQRADVRHTNRHEMTKLRFR